MSVVDSDLTRQLTSRYGLRDVELRHLGAPVNDVVAVNSAAGEFALKLYHRKRTPQAVQWKIDLVRHLFRRGAPVIAGAPRGLAFRICQPLLTAGLTGK